MNGGFVKLEKCHCYGTIQLFGLRLTKYELTFSGIRLQYVLQSLSQSHYISFTYQNVLGHLRCTVQNETYFKINLHIWDLPFIRLKKTYKLL